MSDAIINFRNLSVAFLNKETSAAKIAQSDLRQLKSSEFAISFYRTERILALSLHLPQLPFIT
jgi:hypothetical protein